MKTIYKVFLILLFSLAASDLFAQSDLSFGYLTPKAEINTFVQRVEGAGDLTATVQATDGTFVTTSRVDNASFLVRKITDSGQKQWERRLTFLDQFFASINGIAQTTDGGFVLVGQLGFGSLQFDEGSTATLIKLRPNGIVVWRKTYDVSGQIFSSFSSVIATSDGGVIAIGAMGKSRVFLPDFESLVVRFDATGDVVWGKNFTRIAPGGRNFPLITSTPTPDNGFIVAFPTSTDPEISEPRNGVDVMKITNSGNVVWERSLNTGLAFLFRSAGKTADGGVILVVTGRNSSKLKVIVLKANGTFNWSAGYSLKVPGIFQSVSSPVQTPDGGYVVTGTSRSGRKSHGFVAKIDSSRKIVFQNTFGGGKENAESVLASGDGGFLLFHSKFSELLVIKVNSEGVVPACGFFRSLGSTARTPFGPLEISALDLTAPDDLSLEPFDFELSSFVSNDRVSTACN